MVVRRKSLINIKNYELNGQLSFFGRDNLPFKSINLPKSQKYKNLCNKFKLKKIVCRTPLALQILDFH